MENIKCNICSKEFKRKRSQVLLAQKHYCSVGCQNLSKRKGKIVACFICGRKVYKKNKDLINSKSRKYFCTVICSNQWLGVNNRGKNHPNWTGGRFTYRNILKRTNLAKICMLCKEKDARILVVHHIDQNRNNNTPANLTWLCHNCHFLVHNYKDESGKFRAKIEQL